ncbi:MAG: MFS transporter [Erysipelothrix sp.]
MKLWNKNFTYSFIGTIISAIGSVGLSLGLSVFVYNETNSTLLSALFACLSMIPQFILPIFVGALIDRKHPVKVLVVNEIILSFVFLFAAIYLHILGFNYFFLLLITFLISLLGVVSQLASGSILPKIMDVTNFNKGNSIMNMIYPLSSVATTPLIMWVIDTLGVPFLFMVCTICSLLDAFLESKIDVSFSFLDNSSKQTYDSFRKDIKAGLDYVRTTPSIRSIFLFFMTVMMMNSVKEVLLYPFFVSTPGLGSQNYALLLSVSSLGYICGGLFLYFFKIPPKKRFFLSSLIFIYFIFAEGLLFFMPFKILLFTQFIAGFLGSQSANFRTSAILAMVPENLLGKVNALFGVMINLAIFFSKGLVGLMGAYLPYGAIALIFGTLQLISYLFIFRLPRNNVKEVYNYDVTVTAVN